MKNKCKRIKIQVYIIQTHHTDRKTEKNKSRKLEQVGIDKVALC